MSLDTSQHQRVIVSSRTQDTGPALTPSGFGESKSSRTAVETPLVQEQKVLRFDRWYAKAERAAASRGLVWTLFTMLYLVPTLYLAHRKLLWDDEFFTLYLSRVSSWHELLRALSTGADQHPPSFYYLTHCLLEFFGTHNVPLRLPAIFGFWLLCVGLYEISRCLTTPLWAVVAMLLPLTTRLLVYGSEARAYGLVCGFASIAVLAWMKATLHHRRRIYVPLLAFSLAGAVATHYYAAIIMVCLALAEVTRSLRRRSLDGAVWIAFAFTFLPVLAFLGVIRSARGYSTHFWAVPVWTDVLKFYGTEVALGVGAVLTAVVFLSCFERQGKLDGRDRGPEWFGKAMPIEWAVAFCSLVLLPLMVMAMAKFVTHGFTDRYTIEAIVGISVLVPWFLCRVRPQPRFAVAAVLASLFVFVFQVHELKDEVDTVRVRLTGDIQSLSVTGDQAVAVMDTTKFQRISFYAPRRLASRLVYLSDPTASIHYLGHDTEDRGLRDLRPWFPLHVVPAQAFLATHSALFMFGSLNSWDWPTYEMPKWGNGRLVARNKGLSLLFFLQRSPSPLPKGQPPEQSVGLYDTMPTSGPSLCNLYMGPRSCLK